MLAIRIHRRTVIYLLRLDQRVAVEKSRKFP